MPVNVSGFVRSNFAASVCCASRKRRTAWPACRPRDDELPHRDLPPHEAKYTLEVRGGVSAAFRRRIAHLPPYNPRASRAVRRLGKTAMQFTPGTRLGPYEIVAPLGAGGMGEVYRARDTRLDRDRRDQSPARRARGDPESARTLRARGADDRRSQSSAHLHRSTTSATQDGIDFLVMELVEGETLARPARSRDRCRSTRRCRYGDRDRRRARPRAPRGHRASRPQAGQHHADERARQRQAARLRPCAKLSGRAAAGIERVAARTTSAARLTAQGTILGTLQYMAPEQLEGQEADARTDIFALGAVLYEMATGQRRSTARARSSLIAAILEHEPPPISTLQPLTPAAFEHVVTTCLAKSPDDRWQTARDVATRAEVDCCAFAGPPAPQTAPPGRRLDAWAAAARRRGCCVAAHCLRNVRTRGGAATVMLSSADAADSQSEQHFVSPDGRRSRLWHRSCQKQPGALCAGD